LQFRPQEPAPRLPEAAPGTVGRPNEADLEGAGTSTGRTGATITPDGRTYLQSLSDEDENDTGPRARPPLPATTPTAQDPPARRPARPAPAPPEDHSATIVDYMRSVMERLMNQDQPRVAYSEYIRSLTMFFTQKAWVEYREKTTDLAHHLYFQSQIDRGVSSEGVRPPPGPPPPPPAGGVRPPSPQWNPTRITPPPPPQSHPSVSKKCLLYRKLEAVGGFLKIFSDLQLNSIF